MAERHQHHHNHEVETIGLASSKSRDPVCGMTVDPATAKYHAEHDGAAYHFCSAGCQAKFVAEPAKYLTPREPAPKPATSGLVYTCPMHPQIRQIGPGNCPICGMALEPSSAGHETGPSPELIDMTRRLLDRCSACRAARHPGNGSACSRVGPLRLAATFGVDPVRARHAGRAVGGIAVLRARLGVACATARSTCSASSRSASAPPISTAWRQPLRRGCFRRRSARMALLPVYYEAAAVITVLVLLGQVLELRARERTGSAIRALLNLAPKTARRIRADGKR